MEYENIEFVDEKHEKFYKEQLEKMKKLGKTDVYYRSTVYTLGISETTRNNFNKIFDIRKGEIIIDSINGAFQTSTSEKVTRMAFSLWNRCNYDSEKERQRRKVSELYNVSEIFCCSYAPYFVEALKIRYPEYFKEYQDYRTISIDVEQNDKNNNFGGYIRINHCANEILGAIEIEEKKKLLLKFCKANGYKLSQIFCDIGYSGKVDNNRMSLKNLVTEVNKGKLQGIVAWNLSQIVRDYSQKTENFLNSINGKIITAEEGVVKDKGRTFETLVSKEMFEKISELMEKKYKEERKKRREESKKDKKQIKER